eukprot:6211748-Pleurochrysis_carterae.AAC.1
MHRRRERGEGEGEGGREGGRERAALARRVGAREVEGGVSPWHLRGRIRRLQGAWQRVRAGKRYDGDDRRACPGPQISRSIVGDCAYKERIQALVSSMGGVG